jgi:hypothetical protein
MTEPVTASAVGKIAISVMSGKTRELLRKFGADARLAEAIAEERDQILWTMHSVMIAVTRAITGEQLDGEKAVERLLVLASSDSPERRRFIRFWKQMEISPDDRVAMLSAAYIGAAVSSQAHDSRESAAKRDRLDWLTLSLFPEDARALSTIVALHRIHGCLRVTHHSDAAHIAAVPVVNYSPSYTGDTFADMEEGEDISVIERVSEECFNVLVVGGAIRISLTEPMKPSATNPFVGRAVEGAFDDTRSYSQVFLTESGRALHELLRIVDWEALDQARLRARGK